MADPLPDGTFVVDIHGELIGADRARLAASFRVPTDTTPCLMITVGAKGARCNFNIDGEKVAKIEWGSKVGLVQSVQIVKNLRQCFQLLSFFWILIVPFRFPCFSRSDCSPRHLSIFYPSS